MLDPETLGSELQFTMKYRSIKGRKISGTNEKVTVPSQLALISTSWLGLSACLGTRT